MYIRFWKRGLDIVFSLLGLVVLLPLLAVLSLLVFLDDPGPVIFFQRRVGKDRKIFRIYKFRTMKRNAPHELPTHRMTHPENHLTRIGGFLRRYSLDELPQLVNILLGQMSFVGPRPALWNQDDLLRAREASGANAVRPGLTGWAQINGRDEISIERKAQLDAEYVRRMGWCFDCRCLFASVGAVLSHRGFAQPPTQDGTPVSPGEQREP